MSSDAQWIAMLAAGYRRGAARLEEQRRKDIRQSDPVNDIPAFDGLFELAVRTSRHERPEPMTKAQRVLFGIDK